MTEVILPLFIERSDGKFTRKFYGFMWPDPADRRVEAISKEIRSICALCPLQNECLPQQRPGLGRSLIFSARMTSEPGCRIPKTEKGSLRIGIILKLS